MNKPGICLLFILTSAAYSIDKQVIEKNFSRCASTYDRHADIQKQAASLLLNLNDISGPKRIFEPGCGTGIYTELLATKHPRSRILAMDISANMVSCARKKIKSGNVEWMVGDAEYADIPGRVDLITANAAFQWYADLPVALARYRRMLTSGGILSFSIFGPETFIELNRSLQEYADLSISAAAFTDMESLKCRVKILFPEFSLSEKIIRRRYPSLIEILCHIKHTGTRGYGINRVLTKSAITEIENIYTRLHKELTVTYQIILCRCEK